MRKRVFCPRNGAAVSGPELPGDRAPAGAGTQDLQAGFRNRAQKPARAPTGSALHRRMAPPPRLRQPAAPALSRPLAQSQASPPPSRAARLHALRKVLVPGGEFLFKTDHEDYFEWAREELALFDHFESLPWDEQNDELSFYPETAFEEQWRAEGRAVHQLRMRNPTA